MFKFSKGQTFFYTKKVLKKWKIILQSLAFILMFENFFKKNL